MIYPFGQMMGDKERGRLFSIQKDGSDSVPFIIKKNKLLIGRGDTCEIRIYVEGVLPEHCIISFNDEGRGFVEPVNKCGYTFLNGEPIERQVSLEHNDVITIVKRSFRFFYPSASKFFVASNSGTISEDHNIMDFDPEDAFGRSNQEMLEKRVTFGPRLSPEEFDRNMPPASPLRRGSIPSDKLKAKTPESKTSYFKRALFNSSVSSTPCSADQQFPGGKELVSSTVVFHKLRCTSYVETQSKSNEHEENSSNSRPLFSEVVKKAAANPPKNAANKTFKKYSPKRLSKKPLKIQNSKKTLYKSPRRPINPRILGLASTGHANSPETIVIYKKRIPPVRNSTLSAQKRKSSRLSRASTNSRKSIPEKNKKQDESSESSAANEPFSAEQDVFFHNLPDNEDNNAESENNDTQGAEMSTPNQKSRHSNLNSSLERENCSEKQSPVSPLAVAIDSVAQLDEHTIDKSLKDIHNAVQALACHSNVSPALSNEPCSSDMCMNAVKKLALTLTMVNAFHMYRRIIDDVSGFPVCFPSTSFDSHKDQMKCVQRAGAHQNEDSMDFSNINWFQDILRNFFPGSFNSDVYDSRRRDMLQSCENDFCSEVTSVRNRKNRRSKFLPKRKVAVKDINSVCHNPNCQALMAEHNAEALDESLDMHQNHASAHMNECASCLECTPDNSVYLKKSPATSSVQCLSAQKSLIENDHELNHSTSSRQSLSLRELFEPNTDINSSTRSLSTRKSSVESSGNLNSPARLKKKFLSARKSVAKPNKDSKSPATSRQSLQAQKSMRKSNKNFNSATSSRQSLSARKSLTEKDHKLNTSATSSRLSSSMEESLSEPNIDLSSERSSRQSLSVQKSLQKNSKDLNSPARLVRKSLSARKSLVKDNKGLKSPAKSLRQSLSGRKSLIGNDHELNTSATSSRQSSSIEESFSETNIDLNSSKMSSRQSVSFQKSLIENRENLNSSARLERKSFSAQKSLAKGNKDLKSSAISSRQSLSAKKSMIENDHELNTSATSSIEESLSEPDIDLNSSERSSRQSLSTSKSLRENREDSNSPVRLVRKSLPARKSVSKGNKGLKSPTTSRHSLSTLKSTTSRQSLSARKSLIMSKKDLNSSVRFSRHSLSAPKLPQTSKKSLSATKSLSTSRQSLSSRKSTASLRQSLSTNKSPATSRQSFSARKSLVISRQLFSARKSFAIPRKSLSARKSLPIAKKSLSARKSLIESNKDKSSPLKKLRYSLSAKKSAASRQSLLVQNSLTESNEALNSTATSFNKSLSLEKSLAEHSPILHERSSIAKDVQLQELEKSINTDSHFESSSEKADESVLESKEKSPPAKLKKSPLFSFKASAVVTASPKFVARSISRKTPQHRLTRVKKTTIVGSKPKMISHVSKLQGMTTSKKIKEQKKVQRHRQNVLKKVDFKSMSPKLETVAPKLIVKLPRISVKGTSPKVRLSEKLPSPKVLRKRIEKRKSVVFKSLGVRGKKSVGSSNRRKSLVSNTTSKKQVRKNTRAKKDDLPNIADSDNYEENTPTLGDVEKDIEMNNKTTSKKTHKGKAGSFERKEGEVKDSSIMNSDDLTVKKVSNRGGRAARNKKANDIPPKKTRNLIKRGGTLSFNNDESPQPNKADSTKLKTKRGKRKIQGQETQIEDLGEEEASENDTAKPKTKRGGRKAKVSVQADTVMGENDKESIHKKVLKAPGRKGVPNSSRKKGSNTEENIQILENINNDETKTNDKGLGKEEADKNDTAKPKSKRGGKKAKDSVQDDLVLNEEDKESTKEKGLKAPRRKGVAKNSKKKDSNTKEDIQILENESRNVEKITRPRRGKQNIEPSVSSARKGRKNPDVVIIPDEDELDMEKKRRKLDKKDESKKRVYNKRSNSKEKKNEALNVSSNSVKESLQSPEKDSSKEHFVSKRGKRKRGIQTTDETPAKTDEKSSKQKRGRAKVHLESSDAQKSESGTQKKKRKVNLDKENMPKNSPARRKSDKNSKENKNAKISHSEVTTRTLRTRR